MGQPCERTPNSASSLENAAVVFLPPQRGATRLKKRRDVSNEMPSAKGSICNLDLWTNPPDQLVGHFFNTFLATNDFTGKSWGSLNTHLFDLFNGSSGLKSMVVAIAALDRSRIPRSSRIAEWEVGLTQTALASYSSTLHGLKSKITSVSLTPDYETTVWITLFLGIFEVCIALTAPRSVDKYSNKSS